MAEAEGIPPTASVASVGPRINYVGEWAYAYSGNLQINTSSVEHLSFTTGDGYILAKLYCNGSTADSDVLDGHTSLFHIQFNNVIIAVIKTETATEDMPQSDDIRVLIPPFTTVLVDVLSSSTSGGFKTSVTLTGRVYGV